MAATPRNLTVKTDYRLASHAAFRPCSQRALPSAPCAASTLASVKILEQIRDAVRETHTRLDHTNDRLEQSIAQSHARFDELHAQNHVMQTTLLDLATQQRFVVRSFAALTGRDRKIEDDVDDLRVRVEALERRSG